MVREVVLDTETTGLDPLAGHRIIEIGAIELINHVPTGRHYHVYINPERAIEEDAFKVHGLSTEFLANHPVFETIVEDFLAFVGDATLVIHNARFDMGFINAEMARLKRPELPMSQSVDTVKMARRKFPGAQASLDALCRRFEIDNSHRDLHGALVDADLLASVYLELIGGRQPDLKLAAAAASTAQTQGFEVRRAARPARTHHLPAEEQAAHQAFIASFPTPTLWLVSD